MPLDRSGDLETYQEAKLSQCICTANGIPLRSLMWNVRMLIL